MREPTAEECEAKASYPELTGAFCCWYPQMGGYVGRCVVHRGDQGCFDCYIWHDGEFPFSGGEREKPIKLHHCDPEQFVNFGELVMGRKES